MLLSADCTPSTANGYTHAFTVLSQSALFARKCEVPESTLRIEDGTGGRANVERLLLDKIELKELSYQPKIEDFEPDPTRNSDEYEVKF